MNGLTQGASSTSLISVFHGQIGGQQVQLCDARDLHAFLQVGKRFTSWILDRIKSYGFEEDQDYSMVSRNRETKGRGGDRRSKDFGLSLDMAKELAMVERTEQGRRARRYFIDMERKALEQAPTATGQQPQTARPDAGTLTLTYRDRRFRIVWLEGQPWFCAPDVAAALDVRDAHVFLRYLEPQQRSQYSFHKSKCNIINLAGVNIALLHANEQTADRLRHWLHQALKTARQPENALETLVPINTDPQLEPTVRLDSEEALHRLISSKRFDCRLDRDGRLLIRETEPGALTMRPEHLPGWVRDPAGCPQHLLPELLSAISQRLGGAAR